MQQLTVVEMPLHFMTFLQGLVPSVKAHRLACDLLDHTNTLIKMLLSLKECGALHLGLTFPILPNDHKCGQNELYCQRSAESAEENCTYILTGRLIIRNYCNHM